MAAADRTRWNERHGAAEGLPQPTPHAAFVDWVAHFPTAGAALEVACGRGAGALWLAERGLEVLACDVSDVAVAAATQAAVDTNSTATFEVHDLDHGLPSGPPADLIVCHMFSAPALDDALVQRLAPGGVLALACLSEVGGTPGRFRAGRGELLDRFSPLNVVAHDEGAGRARLLARH